MDVDDDHDGTNNAQGGTNSDDQGDDDATNADLAAAGTAAGADGADGEDGANYGASDAAGRAGEDDDGDEDDAAAAGRKRKRLLRELDEERRERSLGDVLLMMDEFAPLIPDAVTDYYLSKAGFQTDDLRVKRLLALAAQKFVSDIAADALHYCKVRQQATQSKDKKTGAKKNVLTMEDLSGALAEYGVNVKRPEYYI